MKQPLKKDEKMKIDLLITLLTLSMFRFPSFHYIVIYMLLAITDVYALVYSIRKCGIQHLGTPMLILMFVMMISDTMNFLQGNISLGYCVYGLLYALYLYSLERVMYAYRVGNKIDEFITQFTNVFFVLNILSIFSIFFAGADRNLANYRYFLGDKFITSYALVLSMTLFCYDKCIKKNINKKINNVKVFCLWAFTILICYMLHCNTGLIVATLTSILLFTPLKLKYILCRKFVIGISILVFGFVLIIYSDILNNFFIKSIIVDIFHRNIGLTGRMNIYRHLPKIIAKKPLLGYGYLNDAVSRTVGAGNTQNGLLEIVVSYGTIGAIIFFLNTCFSIGSKKKIYSYWVFFSMCYALIVVSIIEVTYTSTIFYFLTFLCKHLKNKIHNEKIIS